ncbi:hypothetical protein FE257_001605 [Aspergillus nanangensis]|uniref:UBC core domain-containing protein n=1 Tax=Aspergillus nanangensis TaxID=2582783 RepID=A0AAD4GX47_ASPNN|nr:hypothetical protein FE257_001605 [Aspergillus nanangensis]
MKEAAELTTSPSPHFHAAPISDNLYDWHFTLAGPPAPSPYANGIYHGRIVLPPTYPLRPPSFRFLTPSGRFEVNREICLSISGHHEESWQPAWGIRTALIAIRSFMEGDAKGQVGGLDVGEGLRREYAGRSREWVCEVCGKGNGEILEEWRRGVCKKGGKDHEGGSDDGVDEEGEEMEMGTKNHLEKSHGGGDNVEEEEEKMMKKKKKKNEEVQVDQESESDRLPTPMSSAPPSSTAEHVDLEEQQQQQQPPPPPPTETTAIRAPPPAPQSFPLQPRAQQQQQQPQQSSTWLDLAIFVVFFALVVKVGRWMSDDLS